MTTQKINDSKEQLSSGKSRANIVRAGNVDDKASKDITSQVIGSNPSPAMAGKPMESEGSSGSASSPGREGTIKVNRASTFNQESKTGEVIKSGLHNYGISSSNLQLQLDADVAQDVAFINTGVILGNRDKKYRSRENAGEFLNNSFQDLNDMFFGASFKLTVKDLPGPPNYAYRKGRKFDTNNPEREESYQLQTGWNAYMPNIVYTGNIVSGIWSVISTQTDGSSGRNPSWRLREGHSVISSLYATHASGSLHTSQFYKMHRHPIHSGLVLPSGNLRAVELKCPEDSSIRVDSVNNTFRYTPHKHGKLAKITISETSWIKFSAPSGAQDKLATAGSGTNLTAMPLVYQDQKVYLGSGLYNGDSFGHLYPSGVLKEYEQKDFVASDGSNPDFSDTGNTLQLGYSRSISQGTGDQYFTNLNALSTFSAVLVPSGLPRFNPNQRTVSIETKMPNASSGVKNVSISTNIPHFKDGYDKVVENLIRFTGD